MHKPRKNKSERVIKEPKTPAPVNEAANRGIRLKALMQLAEIGDANAEKELVVMLTESISKAGDKQIERAEWLGISVRYLKHIISGEVGLSQRHPEIHGRVQGKNDREAPKDTKA